MHRCRLAERFLAMAAARHGIAAPRISAVRELANVMDAAVVVHRGRVLERDHLLELGVMPRPVHA